MGKTLSKNPCLECGSSDNLRTFLTDEGRQYTKCMTPGCENKATTTINHTAQETINQSYTNLKEILVGDHVAIPSRNLKDESCAYYNYEVLDNFHIMNYPNGDQKIRIFPTTIGEKKKIWWTQNRTKQGFFGQDIVTISKNCDSIVTPIKNCDIIICEGEIDAISIYECLVSVGRDTQYSVVSLRDGTNALLEELEQQKDWLLQFRSVIVCVDQDKNQAGQLALQQAIKRCSFKFRVCTMPIGVDPNDMHVQKLSKELIDRLSAADYIRPKGLVLGSEIDFNEIMIDDPPGLPYPFKQLQEITGGCHEGSITIIGAGTGTGKTTIMRSFAYSWLKTIPGIKIANLFLEEKQSTTVKSYIALDNNVSMKEFSKNHTIISKEQINRSQERFGTQNMIFAGKDYTLNSKELFNQLEYLAIYKKYDIIILDHISMVAGCSEVSRNGERRDIDDLMYKLEDIAKKTTVRFICAVHLTDPPKGKSFEEGRIVLMSDFRGSGAIKQVTHVAIGIERDIITPGAETKAQLRVLKNRPTGTVGKADLLYYIEDQGRYQAR